MKCYKDFCDEILVEHETEWYRTIYCPGCGEEEKITYDSPVKIAVNDVYPNRRVKVKKNIKFRGAI